jgi:hypothetical protein
VGRPLTIKDQIKLLEIEQKILREKFKKQKDISALDMLNTLYLTRIEIILEQIQYLKIEEIKDDV